MCESVCVRMCVCVSSNYKWKIKTKIENQRHCIEEASPMSGAFKSHV